MRKQIIDILSRKLMSRNFERKRKSIPKLKYDVKSLSELHLDGGKVGIRESGKNCVVGCSQLGFGYDSFDYLADFLDRDNVSFIGLDFNGLRRSGEKENFRRFKIEEIERDVCSVLDYSVNNFDKVVLFGSCFGADVAYLSAMNFEGNLDGLIMQAPKAPFFPKELKEYIPRAYAIRHMAWRKVARFLRGTDKISLSEATGKDSFLAHANTVFFKQQDLVRYLNRKPTRNRRDLDIELMGGLFDRIVPYQHTREVYERLKERHGEDRVLLNELEIDHYLLVKKPELICESSKRMFNMDSERRGYNVKRYAEL